MHYTLVPFSYPHLCRYLDRARGPAAKTLEISKKLSFRASVARLRLLAYSLLSRWTARKFSPSRSESGGTYPSVTLPVHPGEAQKASLQPFTREHQRASENPEPRTPEPIKPTDIKSMCDNRKAPYC